MEIIGQTRLIEQLNRMYDNNRLSRFIVLIGEKGSGRKTIASKFSEMIDAKLYTTDKANVEYIRDIINQAHITQDKMVYLIPDADKLSPNAKNALLKITEEPPNNAHFIITVLNKKSLPQTILSRATVLKMSSYKTNELLKFAAMHNVEIENKELLNILNTPGKILELSDENESFNELEVFTKKVIENIGEISGSSVFRLEESIKFKDNDNGFDLSDFWITFNNMCMIKSRLINNSKRNMYFSFVRITGEYQNKLNITGINKKQLFDLWILEIRSIYFKYNWCYVKYVI